MELLEEELNSMPLKYCTKAVELIISVLFGSFSLFKNSLPSASLSRIAMLSVRFGLTTISVLPKGELYVANCWVLYSTKGVVV